MKHVLLAFAFLGAASLSAADAKIRAVYTVPGELDDIVGHVQGATCSEQGVYLSHAGGIYKIGWDGRLKKKCTAPVHLGDVFCDKGRIYGALALRKPVDGMKGLIRVWDEDLNVVAEHRLPGFVDGCAVLDDVIYYGLDPYGHPPHARCKIGRLSLDFRDLGVVDTDQGGQCHYGVQTMATDGTRLFCGYYAAAAAKPVVRCAWFPSDLRTLGGTPELNCSEGFGMVPKSVFPSEHPRFFAVRALGGNCHRWNSVTNPPQIRLDFYEYRDGRFHDVTDRTPKGKGDLDPEFLARELNRTKPDYVIYRPHAEAKYDDHGNEHLHVFRGKDGSLCALWTMSRHEGTFTQRPVFAKSRDDGRTWSKPKCILNDPIDPKTGRNMGSWAAAAVSKSGRIYVFYLKHLGDVGDHERGDLAIQYSDDAGETWSPETIREIPRSFCDPDTPGSSIGMFPWMNAYRLANGDVMFALSHYWKNDKCRPVGKGWPEHQCDCEFARLDDIDRDPEPKDMKITFLAKDDKGLRAPLWTAPNQYRCGEEPALVELPDGRLFCVYRNTEGHVWYSVSSDHGVTWRPDEMLRYSDDGEGVLHPLAPCPMFRVSTNEYVLFTHNHDGRNDDVRPHIEWNWRSPLYILKGEFRPGAHQPIWFSRPKEFMNNGDVTITRRDLAMYGDLTVEKDGPVFWYPDRKFFLLGRKLGRDLLDSLSVPKPGDAQVLPDRKVCLELPPGPGNPRNSEGDFVELKDGRVLFAYTRFNGSHGDDHGAAEIAVRESSDGGRTWSKTDAILVKNEGGQNVMSVSFLRLQDGRIALFYLVKNSSRDCRPVLRVSSDEARTWSALVKCVADADVGYYVLNNARAIQLKSGRLVLPLGRHGWNEKANGGKGAWENAADLMTALSDDGGRTWRLGKGRLSPKDPYGKRVVTQEPGAIELKDGRVRMWARTDRGIQWAAVSEDGGETFGPARPWKLYSPLAPATVERLKDGRLVAVWNDHEGRPELRAKGNKWACGVRAPLAIAFSDDDGESWTGRHVVEGDLDGWQCYISCREIGGNLLLGYCLKDGLAWSRVSGYFLKDAR